jgi:putative peptidoglycan lipid II flippase
MVPLAQVGLALATSIGAWINFVLVLVFARRAHVIAADTELKASLAKLAAAGTALALALLIADPIVTRLLSSWPRFRNESELALLALIGGLVYGGLVLVLFGRRWLMLMRRTAQAAESAPIEAVATADASPMTIETEQD